MSIKILLVYYIKIISKVLIKINLNMGQIILKKSTFPNIVLIFLLIKLQGKLFSGIIHEIYI